MHLFTRILSAATVATVRDCRFGTGGAGAPADRLAVLSNWTQPSKASYDAWNSGRQNQQAWAAYQFDWLTDYCTSSPNAGDFSSKPA